MAQTKIKEGTIAAAGGTLDPLPQLATVTESDIACRAYELYLARGCEHGNDVDDWCQAERELQALSKKA